MTDLVRLSNLMKSDWNRRISHDARFWMSDGYQTEAAMWQSGERDLGLLLQDLEHTADQTFLDVGCGIGRLLRAASTRFANVVGIDVADKAIGEARAHFTRLNTVKTPELYVGNGFDLQPIPDCSVDLVGSFAAITSMPVDVMANYLREFHRVLRDDGSVRLQMYLGRAHYVPAEDTLHLRCYERENFEAAVRMAGFEVVWVRPLVLPLQASVSEYGVEAVLVALRKITAVPAPLAQISAALIPAGSIKETEIVDGGLYEAGLEHWTALNYAKTLAEKGEIDKARRTLEFATTCTKAAAIDVSDLMNSIVNTIEKHERPVAQSGNFGNANQKALSARASRTVICEAGVTHRSLEERTTTDGPVLLQNGQCLDHLDKPRSAARAWAERVLAEPRMKEASQVVVFGFGTGYHIEALLDACSKKVSVIEPSRAAFDKALELRDLTLLLNRIHGLAVGTPADGMPQIDFIDSNTELIVRPQTQSIATDYCARIRSVCYGSRGLNVLHPTMAVLGPLTGGTLPIAGYTSRALFQLGQRMRSWDVSGFAGSLGQFEKFVSEPLRKNSLQANYIEMISQVLLEAATEKPIDILICMAQAPISGRVLTELRKQGVITVLWFMEDYLRFTYWRDTAQYYDFVFTIQKGECIEMIRKAGAGHVSYLPMACDPGIHHPMNLSAEERNRWGSPISFVGAGYHNRQQTFAGLADLPFKIWGTEWPGCRPFDRMVQEEGRRLTPEEYVKIFCSSDINLNLHSSSERDGVDPGGDFVNPRTFELASCGVFQLCDSRSHLPELFKAGSEIATFDSVPEMKEKISYYLNHPEERAAIAARGRERVLREHTYQHRLSEMLRVIYSVKFDQLKRKTDASPWNRLLERSKPYDELNDRCKAAFNRGEEPILDGLVADIVTGQGKLSETEQKLLFLHHIRKQIIRMRSEESGGVK